MCKSHFFTSHSYLSKSVLRFIYAHFETLEWTLRILKNEILLYLFHSPIETIHLIFSFTVNDPLIIKNHIAFVKLWWTDYKSIRICFCVTMSINLCSTIHSLKVEMQSDSSSLLHVDAFIWIHCCNLLQIHWQGI